MDFLIPLRTIAKIFKRRAPSSGYPPSPLPRHPEPGINVKKGDRIRTSSLTITSIVENDILEDSSSPLTLNIPDCTDEYANGATFRLYRPLNPMKLKIEDNIVNIPSSRNVIEVAMNKRSDDLYYKAYRIAQIALDLWSANSFASSNILRPIREYGLWWRDDNGVTLRYVDTSFIMLRVSGTMSIIDPQGHPRITAPVSLKWSPSFAYFRMSQITDDLHEAYRNLFLALESLLSEVYPWKPKMKESEWLKHALKYVIDGYKLDMYKYLKKKSGNAYKQFIVEQYNAKRCALFHSKVSKNPLVPGDDNDRAELATATNSLSDLYTDLAKKITGMQFSGSGIKEDGFHQVAKSITQSLEFYMHDAPVFESDKIIRPSISNIFEHSKRDNIHSLYSKWENVKLMSNNIHRVGATLLKENEKYDGLYSNVNIPTNNIDNFEFVYNMERYNYQNKKHWNF